VTQEVKAQLQKQGGNQSPEFIESVVDTLVKHRKSAWSNHD